MNFDPNWLKMTSQMQEPLTKAMGSVPEATFNAAKLLEIQQSYLHDATQLWNQSLQAGSVIPAAVDRRFSAAAWNDNPVCKFSAAAYLMNSKALTALADAVEGTRSEERRVGKEC